MDYNLYTANNSLLKLDYAPKKILVVGAGTYGQDVKILNELTHGNAEIHGLDIEQSVGQHGPKGENIIYINASVYDIPYKSEYFDFAYSFATFEHIDDLRLGWQNMINVLKAGGEMISVSSPLWHSPFGHHKSDIFRDYPWAHLLYPDVQSLHEFCLKSGIKSSDQTDLIHHIRYMLEPKFFNKLKPQAYEEAASQLTGCKFVQSKFDKMTSENLPLNYQEVISKGFTLDEITSSTHHLHCVKE